MGNKSAIFLLMLLFLGSVVIGYEDEGKREESEGKDLFLLQDSKQIVKTDAGEMKIVKGFGGKFTKNPMHIGFITMEPKSLFIPQYLDSNLIIFIRRGGVRLGYIYEDELAEKTLKTGDVYRIPAGSAFYLVNEAEGQRLHVICSIDSSESLGYRSFQSFFIGGGTYPTSVLAGFDPLTLSTAFNVTITELREVLTRQQSGPIVYLSESHAPSLWTHFVDLEQHHKLAHLKRIVHCGEAGEEEKKPMWSWRKLLISVFGKENKRKEKGSKSTGPDSYNLYDRNPDFKNSYGWSMALDESDYSPLSHSGIGVYLVNLTAGSMMAPHINPTATEYGIVLRGTGTIQVVFPNGTLAMNSKVTEGDVFWVPRYFPFCQIASRTGPFEFFGFTTSARKNRPQFLAGSGSLLQALMGPELAAAFGVSEERLRNITNAQRESTILPSVEVSPPGWITVPLKEEDEKVVPESLKSFGNEMMMGFD